MKWQQHLSCEGCVVRKTDKDGLALSRVGPVVHLNPTPRARQPSWTHPAPSRSLREVVDRAVANPLHPASPFLVWRITLGLQVLAAKLVRKTDSKAQSTPQS